jgi:hypothetical protein
MALKEIDMLKNIKIILSLPFLLLIGCYDIPEKLIVPEWDVDLNIPLTNRYYTLDSIIGTQENISIDPVDSLYILHTREYTQTQGLLEFLRLNEPVSEQNLSVAPVNDSRDIFFDFRSDVVEIDSAEFSSGYIYLNVRNRSSLRVNFVITLPGVRQGGNTFIINIPLGPNESTEIRSELAGYFYSEPLNQPQLFTNRFWIQAQSFATGTNTGDDVEFDVEISDFAFRTLSGRFTEQNIRRRTDTIEAHLGDDLTDFRNKITLQSASLRLSARYDSKFENPFSVRMDSITLLARSGSEEIYLTDSTGSRYFRVQMTRGVVNLNFNETNSNVIEIINALPDYFEISSTVKILGNNMSGTITDEDIAGLLVDISTKSVLAIAKSSRIDTTKFEMNEDDRQEIRKAKFSTIFADIENAIPIRAWIKVQMLDSAFNHLLTLNLNNSDSALTEGAIVNAFTGEVISTSKSFFSTELSQEDIFKFAESHYLVTSVTIETSSYSLPDPPLVTIKASDWINLRVYGRVKYRVDGL